MRWSDLPLRPAASTLRWFAGFGSLLLTGLAAEQSVRHDATMTAAVLLTAAVALGLAGWLAPAVLRPVFVGLFVIAFPINWLMMHLLLALVYYGLCTPLGLFFRLTGRDVLQLRPAPEQESFWMPKSNANDVRRYFRPS